MPFDLSLVKKKSLSNISIEILELTIKIKNNSNLIKFNLKNIFKLTI